MPLLGVFGIVKVQAAFGTFQKLLFRVPPHAVMLCKQSVHRPPYCFRFACCVAVRLVGEEVMALELPDAAHVHQPRGPGQLLCLLLQLLLRRVQADGPGQLDMPGFSAGSVLPTAGQSV